MARPEPTPGDSILARCTNCRANSTHVIVTMAAAVPGKVQCEACGRQHKYRPPTAAKRTAKARTASSLEAERKEWEALRPAMDSAGATTYSMARACKVNDVIDHPLFGLGLVRRVAGPHKVEILFADGMKVMRCG